MNQKDIFINEKPNHDYKSIDYFSHKMKLTKKKLRQFSGWFNNLNEAWTPFFDSRLFSSKKKVQIPTPSLLSFLSTDSSLLFLNSLTANLFLFFTFLAHLKENQKPSP